MKKVMLLLLISSSAAFGQSGVKFSAYPSTNSVRRSDLLLIDSVIPTYPGFSVRTIPIGVFMDSLVGSSNFVSYYGLATNANNIIQNLTVTNLTVVSTLPYPGYVWSFQDKPWQGIGQPGGATGSPNNHSGLIPLSADGNSTAGNFGVLGCITNLAQHYDFIGCGYEWIDIDDGWTTRGTRDETVLQIPDPIRFTNSMPVLTDAAHTNHLKISIYTSFGASTDGGGQGSTINTIYNDVQQYMDWGFDGMIVDNSIESGAFPVTWYGENGINFRLFLRKANQAIIDYNSSVTNSGSGPSQIGRTLYYKPFTIQTVNQAASGSDLGGTAYGIPEASSLANSVWSFGISRTMQHVALPQFRKILTLRGTTGFGHYGTMIGAVVQGDYGQNVGIMSAQSYLSMASMGCCSLTAYQINTGGNAALTDALYPIYTNSDFYNLIYHDPLYESGHQVYSNTFTEVWTRKLSGQDRHQVLLINANTNKVVWSGLGSFEPLSCPGTPTNLSVLETVYGLDTTKADVTYTNGAHTAAVFWNTTISTGNANINEWLFTNANNGNLLHNNYFTNAALPNTNTWGHCSGIHGTAKCMYLSNSIPITAPMLGVASNIAYYLYDPWSHTSPGGFTGGTNILLQGNSSMTLLIYPQVTR